MSGSNSRPGVSNDLQERTLRVTNFSEKVTKDLLLELFTQCGPVRNVVHKPDFAFIEFEDSVSVGYSLALMDGVQLYGKKLELQPKVALPNTFVYYQNLKEYEQTFACQPQNWWARFGPNDGTLMPPHLCSAVLNKIDHDIPIVPLPSAYGGPEMSNPNFSNQSEYPSRRGNLLHDNTHQLNHPHQQQSRSHRHQHHHHNPLPPPRPPSVIVLEPPSRNQPRHYNDDRRDSRRVYDNFHRGPDLDRFEEEYYRDDEPDYRRRRRDGGYVGPERRSDHANVQRYNPYSRPDSRSSHQFQSYQDLYNHPHQQPPQSQPTPSPHFERRNSFPPFRDRRSQQQQSSRHQPSRPHARF